MLHLFSLELLASRNGKKLDVWGLFIMTFTIILLLVGIFLAPFGILAGLDPFTQTINAYCSTLLSNLPFKYTSYLTCYILTQWCTLEATRTYIIVLVSIMTALNVTLCQLDLIIKLPLKTATLLMYEELKCISNIGSNTIALFAGSQMGIGFTIVVFNNWIILKGWDLVPVQVYVMIVFISLICYSVISYSVPLSIECDSKSNDIVRKWAYEVSLYSTKLDRKYWSRKVKAQQPISIHYAHTKFEKDTQVNLYSCIVNYTINALMLFT